MRPLSIDTLLKLWTGVVLLFLVVPILVIMPIAFSSSTFLSYPLPGLSLRWFQAVLDTYPWMFALKNSLMVAMATTLLAVPLGTFAAYGLSAEDFPGRALVMALLASPMVVPVVIFGLAATFMLGRVGLQGSFTGLILTHTALALPFVVIPVLATLQGYDRNLTRAGASLGASPFATFRQVTLPLIMPGVLSGAVFAFITSFDEVVVALFVSSPSTLTLPRQLFSGLRDQLDPSVIAIAFIIILVTTAMMGSVEWLRRRSERLLKPEAGE